MYAYVSVVRRCLSGQPPGRVRLSNKEVIRGQLVIGFEWAAGI